MFNYKKMDFINKLNDKVKGFVQKEPLTAEQAWAQSKFGMNSIKEIEEFETQCILDKIQDSVDKGNTYCFIALNPNIDYSNIKETLLSKGFKISEEVCPIIYWIITWNM